MSDKIRNVMSTPSLKKTLFVSILSIIAFLSIFSLLMFEVTKSSVVLNKDGEKVTLRTHASTVEEVLEQASIQPKEQDILVPSKNTKVFNEMRVVWQPAHKVTVLEDGKEVDEIWTTAATVGDLLERDALPIGENDKVSVSADTPLNELNNEIAIEKAFAVNVQIGGKKEKEVMTTSTTVADFLRDQNIALEKHDKVEPALDEMLSKEDNVQITRVEKVTDVVEENTGLPQLQKMTSPFRRERRK
ncbi:ubiquitin-like domain-containing protein [Litoribacterium kuwaitense]|uniref:ubiquitin-like domain-containing protein n=1 Tax=Litoribacterium kuwaitense TaxID=1398745 RepID=UPI001BA9EC1C|nr:ubiquitin-like domain-containing protein [Litoribacterium kuwaitense]